MDHGQSGIDQTFATPAFVEDIKQCIAHKITKVILAHNDSKSDLKSQEQVSSSKRACHHCSRLLVFKEYNRSGTDKWLWCNRCAATEQRSWVRRMALKHVHFKKCQSLISEVEVARSKKLSSLQEKSSPGASSDIDECIRLDQIDLDTELSDQLSTANFKCNECRHELHLHNFLRKERLWMSCNPCNALMKRQRAATKACMRAESANLCCVPAASSASSTEVVAQTVSEPDFDPRALSKPIAVRFASCDWRSVNLLNYAPLAPSAPALHHSLINYTLSVRLLEVFGHWRLQHTPHTSSQDDFVLEVFFLLKKLKSGRIQPWPPLAAWFNLSKTSGTLPSQMFTQLTPLSNSADPLCSRTNSLMLRGRNWDKRRRRSRTCSRKKENIGETSLISFWIGSSKRFRMIVGRLDVLT